MTCYYHVPYIFSIVHSFIKCKNLELDKDLSWNKSCDLLQKNAMIGNKSNWMLVRVVIENIGYRIILLWTQQRGVAIAKKNHQKRVKPWKYARKIHSNGPHILTMSEFVCLLREKWCRIWKTNDARITSKNQTWTCKRYNFRIIFCPSSS